MGGRAIVAGGSIGGLFAAAALRKAGWDVTVYERTGVELSGRGAANQRVKIGAVPIHQPEEVEVV